MSEQVSLAEQPPLAQASRRASRAKTAPRAGARLGARPRRRPDDRRASSAFAQRELRQRRNGGEWLRLIVCDSTGAVEAVAWDEVAECFEIAEPGSAVHITGRFAVHPQYGPKITDRDDPCRPRRRVRAVRPRRGAERPGRAARGAASRAPGDDPEPPARRAPRPLLRAGLPDLASLPRGAGGQVLPPGISPRAARPHRLGRAGRERRRRRPSRASTATSRSPARSFTTSARRWPTTTIRSRST